MILKNYSISGTTYQFVKGQTFEEWVNSHYNTYGFYLSVWQYPSGITVDGIVNREGVIMERDRNVVVLRTDLIDATKTYSCILF